MLLCAGCKSSEGSDGYKVEVFYEVVDSSLNNYEEVLDKLDEYINGGGVKSVIKDSLGNKEWQKIGGVVVQFSRVHGAVPCKREVKFCNDIRIRVYIQCELCGAIDDELKAAIETYLVAGVDGVNRSGVLQIKPK
jgi:hypothetical protein